MSQRITAVVEHGLLRPTTPLNLPEGATLDLVVEPGATGGAAPSLASGQEIEPAGGQGGGDAGAGRENGVHPVKRRSPAEILAIIAVQPLEAGGLEFDAVDHDRILYGEGGAR